MTDEWDNWEDPEPDDGDDDAPELTACPACGHEVYEDAVQCPYCGDYVTGSNSPLAARPLWFWALGLLGGLATVIYLLLH